MGCFNCCLGVLSENKGREEGKEENRTKEFKKK